MNAENAPVEQPVGRENRWGWLLPLIIAVAFVVFTWPVWRWLWGEWMGNDYYSHGVLILPVSLYLAWRRLANLANKDALVRREDVRGLILLIASGVLYFVLLDDKAYFLASFAMIGMIAGLVWTFGGIFLLRKLVFPVSLLLLMVPLPFIERATLPLALFTGVCSGALVKFLGLDVNIVGNAVSLPNTELVIGAQCSGVNSMISLTALTLLCSYGLRGPIWGRILFVLMAIPLAMFGNILRVSNLIYVARYYSVEAAFRFYHDYSGIVFFVIVLALLIPISRMLRLRSLNWEAL